MLLAFVNLVHLEHFASYISPRNEGYNLEMLSSIPDISRLTLPKSEAFQRLLMRHNSRTCTWPGVVYGPAARLPVPETKTRATSYVHRATRRLILRR